MLSNGKESSTITARVTASDRHDKGKWLTEFRFWTTTNIFRVKKMAGFCTDSSDYDYRGTRHNRQLLNQCFHIRVDLLRTLGVVHQDRLGLIGIGRLVIHFSRPSSQVSSSKITSYSQYGLWSQLWPVNKSKSELDNFITDYHDLLSTQFHPISDY